MNIKDIMYEACKKAIEEVGMDVVRSAFGKERK